MDIQWYPGHMTKAKRMMLDNIKLIDIVIELVDARLPISSKNPDIDELAKNKKRLIILNKADLADPLYTKRWESWFSSKGFYVWKADARSRANIKEVTELIKEACKEKIERDRRRGILNRPVRAMVVGIPNVGKSTFINSYAGKACTKTGNRPGVTKGKQWIRLNKYVELLDTPGILWPKFEDQEVGYKLAIVGTIRDELLDIRDLAYYLLNYLLRFYPRIINNRFNISGNHDNIEVLNMIAEIRNCKLKGNELDINKAARILIDEFRSSKLGRVTLEFPEGN